MDTSNHGASFLSFDEFLLDPIGLELRKHGLRMRLPQQPARVLALLCARSGELVTREELRRELWSDDTFVDFEHALNNCVKQIRATLCDDPKNPRFIETIPRRGYRFISSVELHPGHNGQSALGEVSGRIESAPPALGSDPVPGYAWKVAWPRSVWIPVASAVVVIGLLAFWAFVGRAVLSFHQRDFILITDFENHTGDPRFDDALGTAFSVSLEQSRYANVFPRTRLESVLKLMGKSGTERITPALGSEICQRKNIRGLIVGSITRTGQEYALTAELVDPATGAPVRSHVERVHGEDGILDALDIIAGKIRADLGESLYQIRRDSRSLPEVTTASLDALKQYADGRALWHKGKTDDAVAHYRAALALDPNFAIAHAALGGAFCSNAYYQRDQGAQEYKKAFALSSRISDREKLFMQSLYADCMGYTEEAERAYLLYLSRYPEDLDERKGYCQLLRQHGREAEAIQQYKEMLRIAPDDARTYVEMATAYKTLGNLPEAIRSYAEAFRLEPSWLNSPGVNREYGFTLIANGEEAKAEQVFSVLLGNPDTRAGGLQSFALLDELHGRYARAATRLEESRSIAEHGHDVFRAARAHFFLAQIAAGQGHRGTQIAQLDAALSDFKNLGPKVEYGSLVGQEYARLGELVRAEKIALLIAPLVDPHSDDQTGYVRLLQGEIALAKGNVPGAVKLLKLQDTRYGSSVNAISLEALAHAYQQMGQKDDAIGWYEKLMGSSGCALRGWEPQQRCDPARIALAADYLARGDRQKAADTLAPLLRDLKDADPDIPILKHAKAEYAKLQ